MLDIVGSGPATGDSIDDQLDRLPIEDGLVEEGVSELRQVFELLDFQGVDKSIYALDLSIARGLDYYTGTVYETLLNDHPGLGSVCSGGRYDDLASLYTSARLPGVGISIGLTRLFAQLREIGVIKGSESTVAVLVTLLDDAGLGPNLELATALRQAGINTEAVLETARLGSQLKYADRSGIRLAVIRGEDERSAGTVVIRDLVSKQQEEVPSDGVLDAVQRLLARR